MSETNFKFNLGDKVKDTITGFEGVVTVRSQWLNMCNTYGVQPTKLKDSIPQQRQSFDQPQLELVEEKVVESSQETGGPEHKTPQPSREV